MSKEVPHVQEPERCAIPKPRVATVMAEPSDGGVPDPLPLALQAQSLLWGVDPLTKERPKRRPEPEAKAPLDSLA